MYQCRRLLAIGDVDYSESGVGWELFDKKRKLCKTQNSTYTSLKSYILWRIYFCEINKSKPENRTFSPTGLKKEMV
jgi:hypothetical protein